MSSLLDTRRAARLAAAAALCSTLAACADQPTAPPSPATDATAAGKAAPTSGGTVLFVGTQTGASRIYAMNADGTSIRQLTSGPGADETPGYAPGNKRIVFVRRTFGTEGGAIFVANANGTKPVQLTPASMLAANPTFSPDGTRIAFDAFVPNEGKRKVFVMNADGTGVTQVVFGGGRFVDPSWSPDGQRLVTLHDQSGDGAWSPTIVTVATKAVTPLASCQPPVGCGDPAWSPVDDRIVYVNRANGRLIVLDVAQQTARLLTGIQPATGGSAWSADGSRILYHSELLGTIDLFSVDASDTSESAPFVRLTSLGGNESAPAPSR